MISGVQEKLGRKLTAKPSAPPLIQLLKAGITKDEVAEMISFVIRNSGDDYFPVVQSSASLREKWDNLQQAYKRIGPADVWIRDCPNIRGEDVNKDGLTYKQWKEDRDVCAK